MRLLYPLILLLLSILSSSEKTLAQGKSNYVRIARLVIDSTKIQVYNEALKIHAETAVRVEPGVIMLYAVQEKENPARVSVFEIYASLEAYNSHIKTAHFLKYKETVKDMVKSLELIDVTPIALASKRKIYRD